MGAVRAEARRRAWLQAHSRQPTELRGVPAEPPRDPELGGCQWPLHPGQQRWHQAGQRWPRGALKD